MSTKLSVFLWLASDCYPARIQTSAADRLAGRISIHTQFWLSPHEQCVTITSLSQWLNLAAVGILGSISESLRRRDRGCGVLGEARRRCAFTLPTSGNCRQTSGCTAGNWRTDRASLWSTFQLYGAELWRGSTVRRGGRDHGKSSAWQMRNRT